MWNRRPTELGITHPGPHHRTVNSVERFNCNLLDEWEYTRLWPSDNRPSPSPWQHRHNHHRFHTAIGGLPEGRDDSLSFYKNQAATSRPSGRNRTSCVQPKLSWYAVQSPLHDWVGPAQLRNASIEKIQISGVSIHFPHGVVTLESIPKHDSATFTSWTRS